MTRWTEWEEHCLMVAYESNDINYWISKKIGHRSTSACRHKYYELKRRGILNSINSLPQEEKYRLIYKLLAMEGIR
jgi:hypothetical protein